MSCTFSRRTSVEEAFRARRSVIGAPITRGIQARLGCHNAGFPRVPLPHLQGMIREGRFGDRLISRQGWNDIIGWCLAANMPGMMASRVAPSRLSTV